MRWIALGGEVEERKQFRKRRVLTPRFEVSASRSSVRLCEVNVQAFDFYHVGSRFWWLLIEADAEV